jgi:deazaflavin-dependent oxidoreductase (nitroreductase family)
MNAMPHYQKPDFFTRRLLNPAVALAAKLGLSMRGSRVLSTKGRKSGEWRTTPVNPLSFEGGRYLVAPRGETHWVRNVRANGHAKLRVGRKEETVTLEELADGVKVPLIRAYLKEWAWETKQFFGLPNASVPDAEIERIAPEHPVFRII